MTPTPTPSSIRKQHIAALVISLLIIAGILALVAFGPNSPFREDTTYPSDSVLKAKDLAIDGLLVENKRLKITLDSSNKIISEKDTLYSNKIVTVKERIKQVKTTKYFLSDQGDSAYIYLKQEANN